MKEPLVSIFMPVYNGQDYLDDTINSVLSQTYKNFELVCVDDSSTDSSVEIIKNYATKDNRVVLYVKENGGNVPKSFNFVLPKLKGDFYLYMSQDDIISSDLLENAIIKYQQTGSEVIVPTCKFVGGKGEDGHKIELKEDITITGKEAFLLCLKWKMHGFNLVKMSILKDEHLDESVFNSDEFLTFRYLFRAKKVSACKGIFYYYRGNPNSITQTPKTYRLQKLLTNQAIYAFLKENSKFLPTWVFCYWYNVMVEKLDWSLHYIKYNQNEWSDEDICYAKSVFINSWNYIDNSMPKGLICHPMTYLKVLKLRLLHKLI